MIEVNVVAVNWTTDQIIAMAPDSSSVQAARKLLVPRKWPSLGVNDDALWGECQGSGKDPYQVSIALEEPAFKCTCPSRKFPCKHGIALFILHADQSSHFKENTPPTWLADWLSKRGERKVKQEEKKTQPKKPVDEAAQAKRTQQREEKVQKGIEELELRLRDVVRRGLLEMQSQSYQFWEETEKRMIDAQAPGLANFVQELGSSIVLKENWSSVFLTTLARLHLLLESYKRFDQWSSEQQADIRMLIGWTQSKEELLQSQGVFDTWKVLGQYLEEDERLVVQRVWLYGEQTGRYALIINFTFGPSRRIVDRSWLTGTQLEGELIFYPGATPLRALVKNLKPPETFRQIRGDTQWLEAFKRYKEVLKQNPWQGAFPMLLEGVTPVFHKEKWYLKDATGYGVSFNATFRRLWDLIAISGGKPITLFGEWRFQDFWPLGVWAENVYQDLAPEGVIVA